ncbi:MAG: hypothetical protein ACR2QR_04515, partial [Woeseiaceae bacterium]
MSIPASDLQEEIPRSFNELAGQSALSRFRLQALHEELRRVDARILTLDARFTYFISTQGSFSAADRAK